ncbi:GDSL esterase/lipase At5g55050-like [Diospyros lotus]|uniref:GDSL esterase/lipase At5g55050-like n=1 Tax=Diospyros lotus TaxID=55363 RepID=UPI00224F1A35|nr:GDSL esterase/lipase At5g55050-like [Diospyros lotus]
MAKMNAFPSPIVIILLAGFTIQLANATVPAIFIFGDSTADVGTNSYLPGSWARADFPHNGIDFPYSRPTGRFSNGLNSADFLAKLMGFKRSPSPFLFLITLPSGLQKLKFRGVNFASGGSGLLDITGQSKQQKVVPMSEQIQQFVTVRNNITASMGPKATEEFLGKSFFGISIGSNDIFSYFWANSTMPKEQFIAILMSSYEAYIKVLYGLGARKFGIISVPPVGCCPSQRTLDPAGGCLEGMNDFARAFYSALDTLLCNLTSELPKMKYSLGNTYEMTMNVIKHPHRFGFKDVETACCGGGNLNAQLPCNATANLCMKRNEYLFWDMFHPTHTASQLAAVTLYDGPPRFVSPINFHQLVEDN